MRRLTYIALSLVLALAMCFSLSSCSNVNIPSSLAGEWQCEEMASDGITDTGFYHLTVNPKGPFSLYDAAAGNPGMSGNITEVTINEENDRYIAGTLAIDCDTADFDPPFCWDVEPVDTLDFKVTSDGYLQLSHSAPTEEGESVILSFNLEDADDTGVYEAYGFEQDEEYQFDSYVLKSTIENPDENGAGKPVLKVSGDAVSEPMDVYLADFAQYPRTSYVIEDGSDLYALVQLGYDNDYTESVLVRLDGDNTAVTDGPIPYALDGTEGVASTIPMYTKVDILGSYSGIKEFYIQSGALVTDDEVFHFNDNAPELVLKKSIKCHDVIADEDITLDAGETLIPMGTDGVSEFYFKTIEREECMLKFEKDKDGFTITIDGIDQYEIFESLPYAG